MAFWQIISGWRRRWRQARAEAAETAARRDPLAHPDLARMSGRELADLPFDPECIDSD
ncbi:hypothetical protein [Poseidonocella sp. HB161398]|uniref:hypothetical protein n=1 Tax=Poseidonocella sp. HB161398 TaxID=2320855 RepID=UPI001486B922|nr:hypothetical protein [Poseidonocella sp. HB161398]